MTDVLTALFPMAAVLIFGVLLKRGPFPDPAFWTGIERLTYFVCFPALLFLTISTAPLDLGRTMPLILANLGTMAVGGAAAFGLCRALRAPGPSMTSVFQSAVRFNTYVVFGVAPALVGADSMAALALAIAPMILFANLACVTVLARWGAAPEGAPKPNFLKAIATNPLILACAAGLAVNFSGLVLPEAVNRTFDLAGRPAVFMGVVCVGAALNLGALKGRFALVGLGSALNLAWKPLAFVAFAALLGIEGELWIAGLVCAAVPTATSAYILARVMGGDAPLMAGLVTAATLASGATLVAILGLGLAFGPV